MNQDRHLLESLESRRLLSGSVSAATLAGPQSAGTTWVYVNPASPKVLTTLIVHGGVRLGHTKAIRIDSSTKSGKTKYYGSAYARFASTGYSELENVSANNVNKNTSVITYSPAATLYPPAMKAKVTYRYHWAGTTVETVSGKKTTTTESDDYSIKLASLTLTKVHVAAGTFKCYTVYVTSSSKSGGSTSVDTQTLYLAPGVGLVKEVTTDSGSTSTLELKSFKAG